MLLHNIAILQPQVPHYRTEFVTRLCGMADKVDIYSYVDSKKSVVNGFKLQFKTYHIENISFGPFLMYNPFVLLTQKYDTLVLMLHFGHVTTWLLLLTRIFHHKKIILWGQGISVKRYLMEEVKPDWKLKWMIALADGVWLYMDKEYQLWKNIFPDKPIVALGNSLSGIKDMIDYKPSVTKDQLREKYRISQERVFIFCARFENMFRRVDLLEDIIKKLDPNKNAFVIIGAGKYKPDFSKYNNVHDFGSVYDKELKQELFYLSDLYLQPGWVGLSIVEAMAYGKPVCTFVRSEQTLQCVEYSYIEDGVNGMIFPNMEDCMSRLSGIQPDDIERMGINAKHTVSIYTPERMAEKAVSIFESIYNL